MENNLNKSTYFNIDHAFYIGLFAVFLLCIFLFFPIERSVANAHDYLDHWFSFYSIWGRSENAIFDLNYMVDELDGQPLNSFAFSEFNFAELMYKLFSPILAHSLITSFILIVAFIGTFFLLKDYFVNERTVSHLVLILSLSLFFAFLPHKAIRVLGMAGVPLLIWATLNVINNKKQFLSICVILFSPFFVYLPYGGLTNLIVFFLLWIFLVVKRHNSVKKFFFITLSLLFSYIVVIYRSIYHLFFANYEYDSDRNYKEYSDLSNFDLGDFFSNLLYNFLHVPGQHHTTGVNDNIMVAIWLIILLAILVQLVQIYSNNKMKNVNHIKELKIVLLLIAFVFIASVIKVFDSEYFLLLSFIGIPLQLQRIDTLSLTFIIIICAISFKTLLRVTNNRIFILSVLLFPTISLSYSYGFRHQIQETFDIKGFGNFRTFFFSSDLDKKYSIKNNNISDGRHRQGEFTRIVDYLEVKAFDNIKKDLIKKKIITTFTEYGALSIGLTPSVAWYHGFRTFDGRFYDTSVKKILNVQKIYKLEYDKDNVNSLNIISPISYISKHSLEKNGSISPDINVDFFKKLNGKLIFSLYQLENYNELGLDLFGKYKGTVDAIYVYVVKKI